ncbi:MAG: Lrp/AsnC family transcriptional regulator [Candidatus Methylomirabilales bacterium]
MATALVLITADPGKDRAVAKKVKGVPGAEGVCLVSGLYDVVATVRGPGAQAVLDTVYDKIRTIPGVRGSHTMFCAPA